ncbi:MAG: BCAM0308 family protein [Gemmatimonas sp.]
MTVSKGSAGVRGSAKEDNRRWGRAQQDHIVDPYRRTKKLHEPTVCPQCGAVYSRGRWQWTAAPADAERELCQACHRINDRFPAGVVTLSGTAVAAHRDELVHIARNQEEAERAEHPLNRIISIETETPDRIVISTTDIHLPHRIGRAVTRAHRGEMKEHFDEGGYFVRLDWHRDE